MNLSILTATAIMMQGNKTINFRIYMYMNLYIYIVFLIRLFGKVSYLVYGLVDIFQYNDNVVVM